MHILIEIESVLITYRTLQEKQDKSKIFEFYGPIIF